MDEANLQIGIITGQYINEVDLLAANNGVRRCSSSCVSMFR